MNVPLPHRLCASALLLSVAAAPAPALEPSVTATLSGMSLVSTISGMIVADVLCGGYRVSRVHPGKKHTELTARSIADNREIVLPITRELVAQTGLKPGSTIEVKDTPTGRIVEHKGVLLAYAPHSPDQALLHSRRATTE